MAITESLIKTTLRWTFLSQQCQTVQYYEPDGAAFLTADMVGVLEAYWNDIKTAWRALIIESALFTFDSLLGEEVGGGASFAEYAVPTEESMGTRAQGTLGSFLPSFMACPVRLTVGTRLTRPGQKRLPGLSDGDVDQNTVLSAYRTLAEDVAVKYGEFITLGAPVALGVLHPRVVSLSGSPPQVVSSQRVTGYLVGVNPTTQNSRKLGRGS
jgi:hypothetical protein